MGEQSPAAGSDCDGRGASSRKCSEVRCLAFVVRGERRLNPADRRQRKIVATALGVGTLRDLQRQVREAEDRLLESLDEPERQAFRTLLGRIACAVRDMDLTAAPCDVAPGPCDVTEPGS
ncbi:hypothetical protein [Streptomyces sp. NPDC059761]|uniref:hypothetical protein n=1 Tax=Streptomyces sp. NPDC059761 TaxID=3346937 RepID=UPI00364C6251